MSIIKDYLKLIPLALHNHTKIIEGIVNTVKLNHGSLPIQEQEEIIRRRAICETCPFASHNAEKDPLQNYKSSRLDKHCTMCGCNLELKSASLESNCGIDIYNQSHPDNQMELKWTKYQ